MTRLALIALALAASTTAASAYDYGRSERIDAREAAQARRIDARPPHRRAHLVRGRKAQGRAAPYPRMEAWAKRDGHISGAEARRIEAAQDAASRHIYRESHDGQTAWRRRGW